MKEMKAWTWGVLGAGAATLFVGVVALFIAVFVVLGLGDVLADVGSPETVVCRTLIVVDAKGEAVAVITSNKQGNAVVRVKGPGALFDPGPKWRGFKYDRSGGIQEMSEQDFRRLLQTVAKQLPGLTGWLPPK